MFFMLSAALLCLDEVQSMTNEELVAEIQHGVNREDNLQKLYDQNIGLIVLEARRYSFAAEMEDLLQEGFIGLAAAADRYQPERGAMFTTYAPYYIRREMRSYCQTNGTAFRLPPEISGLLMKYRRIREEYLKRYGTEISEKTLARYMRITPEKAADLMKTGARCTAVSLYAQIGEDRELQDVIRSQDDSLNRVLDEEAALKLWEIVDSLPDGQSEIIRMRFKEGKTISETAEALDSTPAKVALSYKYALRNLRSGRRGTILWELEHGSSAYQGTSLKSFRNSQTSVQERLMIRAEQRAKIIEDWNTD